MADSGYVSSPRRAANYSMLPRPVSSALWALVWFCIAAILAFSVAYFIGYVVMNAAQPPAPADTSAGHYLVGPPKAWGMLGWAMMAASPLGGLIAGGAVARVAYRRVMRLGSVDDPVLGIGLASVMLTIVEAAWVVNCMIILALGAPADVLRLPVVMIVFVLPDIAAAIFGIAAIFMSAVRVQKWLGALGLFLAAVSAAGILYRMQHSG